MSDAVIRLSMRASEQGEGRSQFVQALGEGFERIGFVVLTDHGIDARVTEPAYAAIRSFFDLSSETKRRYHMSGEGGARGYTPFRVETAKDAHDPDLKEFWHVTRELRPDQRRPQHLAPNLWPEEIPGFRPALLELYEQLDALGNRVLSSIAAYLGLAENYFVDKVDHGPSILRPLHYPPLNNGQHVGVRSAPHEDINLITLLVASGEPGLEVWTREENWLPIQTGEGDVVVNIGDMLQRLTNHVLPSTTHRVVNPPAPWSSKSRYSVPFFLHPNPEFSIETLPCCITQQRPDRYPEPITAHAYLQERLKEIRLA